MKEVVASGRTVEDAKREAFKELGVQSENDVDIEIIDEGSKGVFGWGTKFARIKVKLLKEPEKSKVKEKETEKPTQREKKSTETPKQQEEKKPAFVERAQLPPITVGELPLPSFKSRPALKYDSYEAEEELLDKTEGYHDTAEKEEETFDNAEITEDELGLELLEEEESGPNNPREILRQILDLMGVRGEIRLRKSSSGPVYSIEGTDLGMLIGKHGQTLEALQFILNMIMLRKTKNAKKITLDVEGYRSRREKSLQILAKKMADKVKKEKRNVVLEPMLPSERRIIHMTLQNNPAVSTFSRGEEPMRRVIISPKKRNIRSRENSDRHDRSDRPERSSRYERQEAANKENA